MSDTPSAAQAKLLVNKKAKEAINANTHDLVDPSYEAMHVPKKPPIIHYNWDEPIKYFNRYFPFSMFTQLAAWTNQNAASQLLNLNAFPKRHTRRGSVKIREWYPVTRHDIRVFFGIILLSDESSLWATDQYWNTDPEYTMDTAVYESISLRRFEQIKRFLKVSDPALDEENSKCSNWYKKVEIFTSQFRSAARSGLTPGRDLSIDELLVRFKGRSKHTMQMAVKAAGQGFKAYAICHDNYLYDFRFTSPKTGITELVSVSNFSSSSSVVLNLVDALPLSPIPIHVIYTDNFFSNIDLFIALKKRGYAAVGTAKAGSFPTALLALRDA